MADYKDARSSPEKREAIAEGMVLREQGLTWKEIEAATGVADSTLHAWHEKLSRDPGALEAVRDHIKRQAAAIAATGQQLIAQRLPGMRDADLIKAVDMTSKRILEQPEQSGGAHGLDRVLDALAKTGGKVTLEVEPSEQAIDVTPKESE